MTRHVRIRIYGHVQGVFFRASARDEARALGLAGLARNEPDGTVLIEVEGIDSAVERFVAWCRHGPPDAHVTHIAIEEAAAQGYKTFSVS